MTRSGESLAPSPQGAWLRMPPHFLRTYCLLLIHFGSWEVETIDFNSAPPSSQCPQAQGGVIYSLFKKHGVWFWCFSNCSSWSPVGDSEPWRMWGGTAQCRICMTHIYVPEGRQWCCPWRRLSLGCEPSESRTGEAQGRNPNAIRDTLRL